ncbi:DoxX family protein, partial [Mesorhizobium sp. M4B.F.Ca.ET.190.01.1.1]
MEEPVPEMTIVPIDLLRILCGVWFLPHLIGKIGN